MKKSEFDIIQKNILLPKMKKGSHIITNLIYNNLNELNFFQFGTLNIFLQNNKSSITINENVCSDVRIDLENWSNQNINNFINSSLIGISLNIPINNGKLLLGTWQGIYFNEYENNSESKPLILTLSGIKKF